ncbi:hypothetical protein GS636_06680 [Ruegeria sp. HKCCD4884]|uniref:hypothetical protein n=1 Tax=Ruegeria sp. HKCCD4884 TaxID=2683022 RepID=UPI0014917F1B|nr:hypothetical protein [Ruegeria sp. HKCCD4884]NOD92466.1 hypothetical protein [Ruegeria sp. HKCCD4884]
MSKRGETKLTGYKKNLVDTPPEPAAAIAPILRASGGIYTEPCGGAGSLIKHLTELGVACGEAFDIEPRTADVEVGDARTRVPRYVSATNPPYERALLMPILRAACDWPLPSWWLIPHDVLANRYFAEVATHVDNLLPVGRVSWIRNPDGSPTGPGFENYTWVRLNCEASGFIFRRL